MNAPADFHAFRATGIGGSDSAPALGLSPWKSPLQLYLEKTGEAPPIEESEPMYFGTLLEPIVVNEYAKRTGHVVETGVRMRAQDHPFMLANLDGFVSATGSSRVVEAKTARDDRGWGEEGSDDIPQAYLLQATHNMIVAGVDACDVPVLFHGNEFRIYQVLRKPELVELVIEGERQFWNAVQKREPPSPQTLAEINLRWRESQAIQVELAPDAAAACQRLAILRESIKVTEAEAEECEATVKKALMFLDTGTIDGVPAVTWKQAKASEVFDAKRFKEEHPEIAAEYEVERPGSRRFLLKI